MGFLDTVGIVTDETLVGAVRCPHCGSSWTHHDQAPGHETGVIVRSRKTEDAHGIEAIVRPGAKVETRYIRDPDFQGRRDDVEIRLACEECERLFVLRVIQHKGMTLLRWEKAA